MKQLLVGPEGCQNSSKWELRVLIVAFVTYAIWQVNAILHHGSWGQDFGAQLTWVYLAEANPLKWFKYYTPDRTSPPLYQYLASRVFSPSAPGRSLIFIALGSVIANIFALGLFYSVIRQFIVHPALRLACLLFLLFLPFAMIQAIVLSSDGLATPLFLALVYLVMLYLEPKSRTSFLVLMAAITGVLTIALAIKFTFLSLIPAFIFCYFILYRTGYLSKKRMAAGIMAILVLPAIFGYLEMCDYRSQVKYNLGLYEGKWPNPISSPFMNLRSMLMVKSVDRDLLSAPSYDHTVDGKTYALLKPNYYSYPGLLHLAVYTDIMNIYQYDPEDNYFGPREPREKKLMAVAVRTGLVFSILTALTLPLMLLWSSLCVFSTKRDKLQVKCALMALLSCAFYCNITLFFPFAPGAYGGGYWTPRLVAPALFCFFVLAFTFVDRVLSKRFKIVAWSCLLLVILQSALHLSFLWPQSHGRHGNEFVTGKEPVLESFS